MSQEVQLLLDTHVWLWLVTADERLMASPVLEKIQSATPSSGRLLVSVISVWELAMLEAKGRLRLRLEIREWVKRALSSPGIALYPLSPGVVVDSTRLPGNFHPDPADRMLVASAREADATLITADQRILAYAAAGHVRAEAV